MSVGPMGGIAGSAAGAPLAQTKGSEVERAKQEAAGAERKTQTDKTAESAEGVGETKEDQESSDRDADGRRLWEVDAEEQPPEEDDSKEEQAKRQAKDPSGESGSGLDLTG